MRVRDLYDRATAPLYSFEFFPPKTDAGEVQLWQAIQELEPLSPAFVSCTEGAGGSTRERTGRIVRKVAAETHIVAVAHVTCVGVSRADLDASIAAYAADGITNLMALRGDPPRGETAFVPAPDGLSYAAQLVELIRSAGDFCVGVAGYPDKHPEAPDWDEGVRHLADKVRAGADFVVTQFFFNADDYFRLRDRLAALGVDAPVIPGIMPITNVGSITRMAELQGSPFPAALAARLHAAADDAEAVRALGVEVATELCERLLAGGAPGLHFFTLNRSTATREIAKNLGFSPG